MRINQARLGSNALVPVQGDRVLRHDAATGRFALRFEMSVPTGGMADGLRWLPDTRLRVALTSLSYNAIANGAIEAATLANNGSDGVLVRFPVARTLARLKLGSANASDIIEGRRTDGRVVTEDAFAAAAHGSEGAQLDATDVQLVLRVKPVAGTRALRAVDVQEVLVSSAGSNVRIGIALPGFADDISYLPPTDAPIFTNPATASELGLALATLLQTALDRFAATLAGAPLPASLTLAMQIESDTPARLNITAFELNYRLRRARFADGAEKHALSFSGNSLTSLSLPLELPAASMLAQVQWRMAGEFGEAAAVAPIAVGPAPSNAPSNAPSHAPSHAQVAAVPSDLSLRLAVGDIAATSLVLDTPMLALGIAVGLVSLAERSAARLRLRQDAAGYPGDVLAEAELRLDTRARLVVQQVELPAALVLPATGIWIELQCTSGGLLWQLIADAQGRILRAAAADAAPTSPAATWQNQSAAAAHRASAGLVSAQTADDSTADRSGAFKGVQLRFGAQRLRGSVVGTTTEFALAPVLAGQARPDRATSVELALLSAQSGRVIVYPPQVEYEV